ncbi:hypothetical protein ACIBHX_46905 [Nonomuraea sp. NPDC050536]|uniref:hypothetical protein n=1 Tax=Nonomuraea sp. NPDC050536 TaxID=3364366 RepID=UPI0037C5E641
MTHLHSSAGDEACSPPLVFQDHPTATNKIRLAYVDAVEEDWQFRVLWSRQHTSTANAPQAQKRYNGAHCQRCCMIFRLCQACGQSARLPNGGVTWVIPAEENPEQNWSGITDIAPTCARCIDEAIMGPRFCTRLRRGCHVYAVRHAEPYGVLADVYRQHDSDPKAAILVEKNAIVPLEAFPLLESCLATQLVVQLSDLTSLADNLVPC